MRISAGVRATTPPAIVEINALAAGLEREGRSVLHLGQGVPDITPPPECLEAFRQRLSEPFLHRYTPDPGTPDLRQALADDFARRGIGLDPEREILVTVGANHAFFQAVVTLLEPGDSVAVPSPFYFNHAMTLEMLKMHPVEWPLRIVRGAWRLDFEALAELERNTPGSLAGVVCINPNNPTGAVFPAEDIAAVTAFAATRGIPLFYDEVYQRLDFGLVPTTHPLLCPGGRECTVVLGSFSKVFGMTGWRAGYLAAPPEIVEEMLKVQDCSVICAPHPAQFLAAECLRRHPDYPSPYREVLKRRSDELAAGLAGIPGATWIAPGGAIFGMAALAGVKDSRAFCLDFLRAEGVAALPGRAFGAGGEGMIRLSFGFADEERIREACRRLRRHLGH